MQTALQVQKIEKSSLETFKHDLITVMTLMLLVHQLATRGCCCPQNCLLIPQFAADVRRQCRFSRAAVESQCDSPPCVSAAGCGLCSALTQHVQSGYSQTLDHTQSCSTFTSTTTDCSIGAEQKTCWLPTEIIRYNFKAGLFSVRAVTVISSMQYESKLIDTSP